MAISLLSLDYSGKVCTDIFLSSCSRKLFCCSNHVQPKDELIKTAIVAIATIASLLQVLLNKYSMTG